MLNTRTALVTGASGFVGARLVRRLTGQGLTVRALVRSEAGACAVADTGCEIWKGDVTDAASLGPAFHAVDVVFHCASGGSTVEETHAAIAEGTRHVAAAAAKAHVRRLVHVSTVAVHGTPQVRRITEDSPLATTGSPYAIAKVQAEQIARRLAEESDLELVILRPTLVYGPGSHNWILQPLWRVRHERLPLIAGGSGLANLVYVDDVVEALILAGRAGGVAGEAFLVSGAEPVTWREYVGHLCRMCGKPLPPPVPLARARIGIACSTWARRLTGRAPRIEARDLTMMTQPAAVDISRARRRLGFVPQVLLGEGMARTETWLRQRGHLAAQACLV